MKRLLWSILAWFIALPPVADYIIRRAIRTPYTHIDGYMNRYWLLNPYPGDRGPGAEKLRRYPGWPSARIHHILRRDNDQHPHDHPWDARTIILKGWYEELRGTGQPGGKLFFRERGDTSTLKFNEYHNITNVSAGGVWTLFITYEYRGTWGFMVDGVKVPYKTYLKEK